MQVSASHYSPLILGATWHLRTFAVCCTLSDVVDILLAIEASDITSRNPVLVDVLTLGLLPLRSGPGDTSSQDFGVVLLELYFALLPLSCMHDCW